MKKQSKADLMMIFVTVCWGSSYLFMKIGLHTIQQFNLIALRFGIAFLLSAAVFFKRLIKTDLKTLKYAFLLGSTLFLVFAALTFGLKYTSTSNASFLVSLVVIFVPVLSSVYYKKPPDKRIFFAAFSAIVGIGLLTLNSTLTLNEGDILCILSALFYAFHITATGLLTRNSDSIALGVLQLGVAGLWGLIFSLFSEKFTLPNTIESWFSVLMLGILCSAMGFIIQVTSQRYTTPSHIGVIFSLESVFAAVFAFMFLGETLLPRGYLGALIILMGVLIAEVDIRKLIMGKLLK